jgi:hypothetical protein
MLRYDSRHFALYVHYRDRSFITVFDRPPLSLLDRDRSGMNYRKRSR